MPDCSLIFSLYRFCSERAEPENCCRGLAFLWCAVRDPQELLVGQGFGATARRLRKNELPPSLKASEESSAGGQFLASLIKFRIISEPGRTLPSWSHDQSRDDFAGGCADCSYIQLLPSPPSLNEPREKLARAELCVAAAGRLLLPGFVGHSTLPGASLPGKNLVFWESCGQAGAGSPSPLALLLRFFRVRG